jgi:hypothetical protein
MKNATQVMLERARIQNQNACIAEDCINEESDRFNNSRRRSSVGATATANLSFSHSSYDTPGATTRSYRENRSQLPPHLSAYTMIEVEGQGDCLPLSVAFHIYSSISADAGRRVRSEVTKFMLDNFQEFGNTLARDRDELIENARSGRWLGEEFLTAAAALYNVQFTVYWDGDFDYSSRAFQYTSNQINHDRGLKVIFWKNDHFTPLVLTGRSGASRDRYRTHSVSSSSGSSRQSTTGSSNVMSTTSKNSASKKSGSHHHHQHHHQNSTSRSGNRRRHRQSASKNSHLNSASKGSRHHRKASKCQSHRDSGTDSISTGSSMGGRHHNRHHQSSESKSGKHHHRSASKSKSHRDPPKSQHHHDSRKDIIITHPYVGDRHLHSSVSKSESHHRRSHSASKIRDDPPGSTSKSKAESDFDGSAILRGVLSDHSSYQSSNHHTSPGGTSEYAEYIPDDIIVNIDAAPSDNMPKTPSTKGSIIDQIGSLGSHFTRLVFSATPNPASLETYGDVPSAIVSTTSGSRPHPPSTTHHQNRRHPSTAGTTPYDLDPTTHNSHHPRRRHPSPSAYSRQTEKAHNNNAEGNSVAATRGHRTKKGIRKVDY